MNLCDLLKEFMEKNPAEFVEAEADDEIDELTSRLDSILGCLHPAFAKCSRRH